MKVKLKVVHGKLQNRQGADAGLTVGIRGSRFVIGSGEDTNMRCPSTSVSPRHCELATHDDHVMIHDLGSESGTFVNGERLAEPRELLHGDRLRVGRLEFEVVVERSPFDAVVQREDPVADYISDMLVEGDEQERARRLEDPEVRQFRLQTPQVEMHEPPPPAPEEPKRQRPPKKPPGKLPPPPPITADTTVEAAEETLKKIFDKQKP